MKLYYILVASVLLCSNDGSTAQRRPRTMWEIMERNVRAPPGKVAVKSKCIPVREDVLRKWMGMNFHPRYMSNEPPYNNIRKHEQADTSFFHDDPVPSGSTEYEEFFVSPHFNRSLDKSVRPKDTKQKRSANLRVNNGPKESMHKRLEEVLCKSALKWHDLTDEYFPRYIRENSCTQESCYFDTFKCIPRAFTAFVIRRSGLPCYFYKGPTDANEEVKRIVELLIERNEKRIPIENFLQSQDAIYEEWHWQEIAITLTCECGRADAATFMMHLN